MACFLVPVAEAVITTAVNKVIKKRESKAEELQISLDNGKARAAVHVPLSKKVGWLTNMLWGGSALLAFEHLWHGEIVPWAPFLTAVVNPADTEAMLSELATAGVGMAALTTAVWGGMVVISNALEKKAVAELQTVKKQ